MAVMTGTNRNRRRPETESAEEAERHTLGQRLGPYFYKVWVVTPNLPTHLIILEAHRVP